MFDLSNELIVELENYTQDLVITEREAMEGVAYNMTGCNPCSGCGYACAGGCSGSCKNSCTGSCHRYSR